MAAQVTFFETVSKSYVDVPVTDAGVDTVAFLEATESLIKMFGESLQPPAPRLATPHFHATHSPPRSPPARPKLTQPSSLTDLLGSAAFTIVQNDMTGNVAKIRARFLATPDKSATLEQLVENEKGEKKRTATEGLLWLLRGLKFTQIALSRSLADKSEELTVSFTKAYEATLKKFHSFVVKPLFGLAMKSCPYRVAFYEKLGSPLSKVETDLAAWLAALDAIIVKEEKYYETGNYAKGM
ncbi:hypothetical protein P7C70_g5785, partial [Phenoliferia sp. Uapishka_3]